MEPDFNKPRQGMVPGINIEQGAERKSLPSRSELQRRKKKKKKRKIKFPMLKLLALFFVLMPISFYMIYMYYGQGSTKRVQEEAPFETIEWKGEAEEAGLNTSTEDSLGDADSSYQEEENGYKVIRHTVQEHETLAGISEEYYSSEEGISLIKKWNGLEGSEVKPGQTLKIPIKQ
ncbi:LysM domain-containing protein [Bacillus sp. V5-8f]|uniref:LysM peptidoglycan-binding domain-containing protein n=1 Tax=Bacillus sp. V5-8f TaxID=2053044 RepID=UPI000C79048D|nr:LysM domain-containing protein [Bacillus sp. V5-8f]PLT34841.1 hypothetical protein CUU64_05400 [Bacillus sp. V5-8f]